MNRMIALSALVLSACAMNSKAMRAQEDFDGPWQGVLVKGQLHSRVDFRFSASEGGYQGFYWGSSLTPVALKDLRLGSAVHFEVPQLGVFDGTSSGETIEGTFSDGSGDGSFRLEKDPHLNDPVNFNP